MILLEDTIFSRDDFSTNFTSTASAHYSILESVPMTLGNMSQRILF